MTRFVTFILLFVIGTQSTSFADVSSSSEELDADFVNLVKELFVTLVINATVEEDEENCGRKNLPAVAQDVRNNYDVLLNCFDANTNITELVNTVTKSVLQNDDTLIPKLVCERSQALLSCAHDYTDLAKPCTDDDDQFKKDLSYNVTNSGLKYFCDNDRARFYNFIRSEGGMCVTLRSDGLSACYQNYTDSSEESSTSSSSEDFNSMLTSLCAELRQLHTCTVNELRHCENKTPANVVDGFFEELKKASRCENLNTIQLP